MEIKYPFNSAAFLKTWQLWKEYRKEIKKPYKGIISEQAALMKLSKYTEEDAIAMIMQSIENSWQGIFEIKKQNGKQQTNNDLLNSTIELFRNNK